MPLPDLRRRSTSTIEALESRESDFQTGSAGLLAAVVDRTRDDGDPEVAAAGPRETVKRHPALVPLSEEHHHELAHARRLLRAAGAGPEQRLAVASAYLDAFFTETVKHFRCEEEILGARARLKPAAKVVAFRVLLLPPGMAGLADGRARKARQTAGTEGESAAIALSNR